MRENIEDYIGKTYNRWTIIGLDEEKSKQKGQTYCFCECSCENKTVKSVNLCSLKRNENKSCGCWNKEVAHNRMRKFNTYDMTNEYGICYTVKNEIILFSKKHYEKIKPYYWGLNDVGYSRGSVDGVMTRMHRFIMDCPEGMYVDHINGNKNDNREENLRICTNAENCRNVNKKGYSYDKEKKKFSSSIMVDYKNKFLGYFDTEEEARSAYELAKLEYHGDFAPEIIKNKYKEKEEK